MLVACCEDECQQGQSDRGNTKRRKLVASAEQHAMVIELLAELVFAGHCFVVVTLILYGILAVSRHCSQ
jgi:hypothetical protein